MQKYCTICNSKTEYFLSKNFKDYGFINECNFTANYLICTNCKFVFSQTHYDMKYNQWKELNEKWHSSYFNQDTCVWDERWIIRTKKQAKLISDLCNLSIIQKNKYLLDYGCGDGKLSNELIQYNIKLNNYDKYFKNKKNLKKKDLQENKFSFITTTSVFEHLYKKEHFEYINSLVSNDGILAIHTFISEDVPQDPNWFYFFPIHCSFHTNKSMQILFEKWGYKQCIFNENALLYFLLKTPINPSLLDSLDTKCYCEPNFVNFWK